jgi:type IV secretory pathway VirB6-like protein
MVFGHLLPQKGNCDITFNYFLLFYCRCHIHFEIWIAILKRGDLEVIAINGMIILKCILKKYFCSMWTAFVWL